MCNGKLMQPYDSARCMHALSGNAIIDLWFQCEFHNLSRQQLIYIGLELQQFGLKTRTHKRRTQKIPSPARKAKGLTNGNNSGTYDSVPSEVGCSLFCRFIHARSLKQNGQVARDLFSYMVCVHNLNQAKQHFLPTSSLKWKRAIFFIILFLKNGYIEQDLFFSDCNPSLSYRLKKDIF